MEYPEVSYRAISPAPLAQDEHEKPSVAENTDLRVMVGYHETMKSFFKHFETHGFLLLRAKMSDNVTPAKNVFSNLSFVADFIAEPQHNIQPSLVHYSLLSRESSIMMFPFPHLIPQFGATLNGLNKKRHNVGFLDSGPFTSGPTFAIRFDRMATPCVYHFDNMVNTNGVSRCYRAFTSPEPFSISVLRSTSEMHSSSHLQPIKVGGEVLFFLPASAELNGTLHHVKIDATANSVVLLEQGSLFMLHYSLPSDDKPLSVIFTCLFASGGKLRKTRFLNDCESAMTIAHSTSKSLWSDDRMGKLKNDPDYQKLLQEDFNSVWNTIAEKKGVPPQKVHNDVDNELCIPFGIDSEVQVLEPRENQLRCHVDGCIMDTGDHPSGHNCSVCKVPVHLICNVRVLKLTINEPDDPLFCSKCFTSRSQ